MEIKRQTGSLSVDGIVYTATVLVRHNPKCADKDKGGAWTKCDCRKSILTYNGVTKKQDRLSAHTRSWSSATVQAEAWLDKFDPSQIAQARKKAAAISVEKAVHEFIADKIFCKINPKTIDGHRCLLGDVNAEGVIVRDGKLLPWLDRQNPRVESIADVTADHLREWRNSWDTKGSDLTAYMDWGRVRNFFKFCEAQGWLVKNPAANIKRPKVAKGNRTAIFTDLQYGKILEKIGANNRLYAFVVLLRWSAMAIVDAVLFNIDSINAQGVLQYKRKKTGMLATVKLPNDVVLSLRNLAETNKQPFLRADCELDSSVHEWRITLQDLFTLAEITTVKTEVGERKAHPHMFRDTCIVWFLRRGMSLHTAAKILGHKNDNMIQNCYLPFVKELQQTVVDETEAILSQAGAD